MAQVFVYWGRCNLGLVVLCVIACFQSTTTAASTTLIQPSQNWFAAREYCRQQYHGDLVTNDSWSTIPYSTLNYGTYYWVGALEYTSWSWTKDRAPLFRYIGYSPLPDGEKMGKSIPGNSVYECYRDCDYDKPIGLSKTSCYCLDVLDNLKPVSTEEECPGNFDEKCGNRSGMSVYKSELSHLISQLHESGQCAYAQKTSIGQRHLYGGRCSEILPSACYDEDPFITGRCGGYQSKYRRCNGPVCIACPWNSWWGSNRYCVLLTVNDSNKNNLFSTMLNNVTYWVGLHRYISRKWTTKFSTSHYETWESTESGRKCLTLRPSYQWHLEWRPCDEKHPAICVIGEENLTERTTTSWKQTSSLTERTTTSWKQTSREIKSDTISSVTATPQVKNVANIPNKKDMNRQEGNTNLTGTYIGAVIGSVLLILLLVTLVVLQRQGRLCFKKTKNEAVTYNAAADNVTYGLSASEGGPSVIPATSVNPVAGNIATTAVSNVIRNGREENANINNVYSVVSRSRKKHVGDYKNNDRATSPVNSAGEGDDDYNTIRQTKSPAQTDHCYDHIGTTENDYDVAGRSRQRNDMHDTYHHFGDSEGQDTTARDKVDNVVQSGRQHTQDEDGNIGETGDYYNRSSYSRGNGDYYNIGFTLEKQPGGDENDYTLAKAITDI